MKSVVHRTKYLDNNKQMQRCFVIFILSYFYIYVWIKILFRKCLSNQHMIAGIFDNESLYLFNIVWLDIAIKNSQGRIDCIKFVNKFTELIMRLFIYT